MPLMYQAEELVGVKFGYWTIIGDKYRKNKHGQNEVLCKCVCGVERYVPLYRLRYGKSNHCGCKTNFHTKDITGMRFGKLTALYRTGKSKRKSVLWHCRCDCGNEVDCTVSDLGTLISCGCAREVCNTTQFSGTVIETIASTKLSVNNTSGHTGVYFDKSRNLYKADIMFQRKSYRLGRFKTYEEACEAREEAEDVLFKSTIEYHKKWDARAKEDPEWAKENPVQIFVTKKDGHLRISFLPEL